MTGGVAIAGADQESKLAAIAASGACAERRVMTLDFVAIQRRLGALWQIKRDTVWRKIDGIVEKHADRSSIWARIGESEYLICLAEVSGNAAHGVGFRIMEEVLTFFFGAFDPTDLRVNRVTSVRGTTLERIPVDPSEPAAEGVAASPRSALLAQRLEPILIDDAIARIRVVPSLQSVVRLDDGRTIGVRVGMRLERERSARLVSASERASLSTLSITAIDRQVLGVALALMEGAVASVIVAPITLHTLSNSRARLALLNELNRLDGCQRDRLVIELVGSEAGTPSSRLVEAAALLKPFCRHVLTQASAGLAGVAAAQAGRSPLICVSAADLGNDGSRLASGLLAFGQAARGTASKLVAADLPSERFLPVCRTAGFTIATIASQAAA